MKAKDWYNKITNLSRNDMHLMANRPVTDHMITCCRRFLYIWIHDPTHAILFDQLPESSGVNEQMEAIAIGQMAYDVLTRGRDILSKTYPDKGSDWMDSHAMRFNVVLVYDMLKDLFLPNASE
jgi:hypothetical protein